MGNVGISLQSIEIEHKEYIESLRKSMGHELSSHAFASLFLWQKQMGLSLYSEESVFSVKCSLRGENTWFFPCGSEEAVYGFIKDNIQHKPFSLCYLRGCDAEWLENSFPDCFVLSREEQSDEYICDISEYIAQHGGKYADLRKRIRHIDRNYDVEVQSISDANIADANEILSEWECVSHNIAANGLTDEKIAKTALDNRKALGIEGSILYLDKKPSAVFAGFFICDSTVDALIGKCVPDAPPNTIYYAVREFMKKYQNKAVLCNLEEDLGIEGIRFVKNKMNPVGKNEIWKAELK